MNRVQRVCGATWRLLPAGVLLRRPGPTDDAVLLTGAAALVWCTLENARMRNSLLAEVTDYEQGLRLLEDAGLVVEAD